MASLTLGTLPNQVPTNGDLGELAFMNRAHVEILGGNAAVDSGILNSINRQISATAVKIFVYDTRKDSDGGAWRRRTYNTSWYNETLNTTVRGSRRDFPAVAVIVVTSTTVTIYDGDDPTLPMWMVFPSTGSVSWGTVGTSTLNAVVALNGIVIVSSGINSGGGIQLYNFPKDDIALAYNTTLYSLVDRKISTGRLAKTNIVGVGEYTLLNYQVYDVAMTVLPGAPIDAATGLPIPTIAVGSVGGVTIIHNTGQSVNITHAWNLTAFLKFSPDNQLVLHIGNASGQGLICKMPIPYYSTSISSGGAFLLGGGNIYSTAVPNLGGDLGGLSNVVVESSTVIASMTKNAGLGTLVRHLQNPADNTKSAVAYINSVYNSGWMVGDIQGSWCSDSTSEIITDYNYVSNPTMSSGISGYTAYNGSNTSATYSGGNLVFTALVSGQLNGGTYTVSGLTVGKQYYIQADYSTSQTNSDLRLQISGIGLRNGSGQFANASGSRTVSDTFVASSTSHTMEFLDYYSGSSGRSFTVNNVFLKLADSDRSVKKTGSGVFGAVTKTQVAANSSLVGYFGNTYFSSTNYLKVPYVAGPGTGDFSICLWVNPSTNASYEHYFTLGGGQGGSSGFTLKAWYSSGNITPYFYYSGGDMGSYSASVTYPPNTWTHIVAGRKNGYMCIYINGIRKLVSSSSNSINFTDTSATLGWDASTPGEGMYGGLSLVRYSLTFPSEDIITKMYNEEKYLFQDNAKAVLYGSDNTVVDLAYDEDTQLLHAGTSAGRSVFRGLRRVDNTAVAVSYSISASNGMVAEQ
jgi:trimeric autotransporter adhesin